MTDLEKKYYNTFLSVSRSSRSQPYKIRTNFDGFEKTPDYMHLTKIVKFFAQFPQIKPDIYFKAPYMLYKDEQWFDLKFFCTQKAVAAYTAYYKNIQDSVPDSDVTLQGIKDSLRFIGMFCLKNNIKVSEYPMHSGGIVKQWMKHVKEHNVNLYMMFGFEDTLGIIQNTPKDELDLFLGVDLERIRIYRQRYATSKVAKRLVKEGLVKITDYVNRNLNSK